MGFPQVRVQVRVGGLGLGSELGAFCGLDVGPPGDDTLGRGEDGDRSAVDYVLDIRKRWSHDDLKTIGL